MAVCGAVRRELLTIHKKAVEMKEIIEWLIAVEDRACRFYESAAARFVQDAEFNGFLIGLANDEKSHGRFMRRAAELTAGRGEGLTLVSLEDGVVTSLYGLFDRCERGIDAGRVNKDEVMECIISTEYSEWNDLFLYVINTFKRAHKEFIPAAAELQRHKRRVERYIAAYPEYKGRLDKVRTLPAIWEEKILVADDESSIAEVLVAILGDEGAVDVAANGAVALDMLSSKYYAAVVSDVDMPVMDGMDFYKSACGRFPGLKDRFLFFTASSAPERIGFFEQNKIPYIQKPAGIKLIRDAVIRLLDRGRE